MRVLFVPKGSPSVTSSRTRIYNLLPYLEEQGIETDTVRFPQSPNSPRSQRAKNLLRLPNVLYHAMMADVVYVQRVISPQFIRGLRQLKTNVVFDLDDAIYLEDDSVPHQYRSGFRTSVIECLQTATDVVVASYELSDFASKYTDQVSVFPSTVDVTQFPFADGTEEAEETVLGWIGNGPDHIENLRLLVDPISDIVADYDIRLRIVGTRGSDEIARIFEPVADITELVEWVAPDEVVEEIHRFDIGLSPLVDTPFTRAKCPVKTLEYMASGTPAVASRVGMHNEFIRDGVDGYLADDTEWQEKLKHLIESPELRDQISKSARARVEANYSSEALAGQLGTFLRELP